MSPNTHVEKLPEPPAEPHFECAEGCTPAHRKLRRFMLAIVRILILTILGTLIFIAHTGGLTP